MWPNAKPLYDVTSEYKNHQFNTATTTHPPIILVQPRHSPRSYTIICYWTLQTATSTDPHLSYIIQFPGLTYSLNRKHQTTTMFKKLKSKIKGDENPDQYAHLQSSNDYSHLQSSSNFHPSNPYYTPPPQAQQHDINSEEKYQPPTGPPPSYGGPSNSDYAPPLGPPLQQQQQYHDWTVIPDNSLLPPPPSIGYEDSPTANATGEDSDRAAAWQQANPLWPPASLSSEAYSIIQNSHFTLLKAPTYTGDVIAQTQAGHWKCRTHVKCNDSSLLTNLPMYCVYNDSPLTTHRPKTIYFELKVQSVGRGGFSLSEAEAGIAIGFIAPPYPTFRLPGWQRGSLGIHGDDGRKYINDTFGGTDFTTTFLSGDVVGIGMTFAPPKNPPSYEQSQQGKILDIDVFFTRNGVREGGWDGNEELDERSVGGTMGLRGECDLFPAVGVFGGVDFEVFFHPSQWLYNPLR
ncbi:unnamed protein product [Periconia digitata]|uniref:SPRY domain-containing protein n=1 Tax=Periconia digitata TaxID=1303443 RepID=A0A9W4URF4_9PLEO|nr:unnamed protein product [Periconia digitata]